jgi:hypothetical protein
LGAQHANGGDTRTVFDEIEQAQHEPSLSEHPAGVSQIDGGVHRETHADEPIRALAPRSRRRRARTRSARRRL